MHTLYISGVHVKHFKTSMVKHHFRDTLAWWVLNCGYIFYESWYYTLYIFPTRRVSFAFIHRVFLHSLKTIYRQDCTEWVLEEKQVQPNESFSVNAIASSQRYGMNWCAVNSTNEWKTTIKCVGNYCNCWKCHSIKHIHKSEPNVCHSLCELLNAFQEANL